MIDLQVSIWLRCMGCSRPAFNGACDCPPGECPGCGVVHRPSIAIESLVTGDAKLAAAYLAAPSIWPIVVQR